MEVKAGTTWKHYKGTAYEVLAVAFAEADRTLLVVYRKAGDPDAPVWARPLSDWTGYAAAGVPRYTPVEG